MKTNGEPIFCSNVGRDGKTCGANLTQNPRAVILKVVRSYYGSIQNVNGEPRGKKADDWKTNIQQEGDRIHSASCVKCGGSVYDQLRNVGLLESRSGMIFDDEEEPIPMMVMSVTEEE